MPAFVKGPGKYLRALGIRLRCPVEPARNAVLDAAHEARLNHEIFYFSSAAARARFLAELLRWCGKLTDPVSGRRFRPTLASPRAAFAGRAYYFETAADREQFRRDPARYAEPERAHELPPRG